MSQETSPEATSKQLPMLPLRDVVVYPQMVIPLFVGRAKSILALDAVMSTHKQILLVAQKDAGIDDPGEDDLYRVGSLATVLQMLKLPDGTVKVLVEGNQRVAIRRVLQSDPFPVAEYDEISGAGEFSGTGADALVRALNAE
ncbi:MAG: endopeptidase La, partial [Porticoccaceae bacterium]